MEIKLYRGEIKLINKTRGNNWEKECLKILGEHGFFATKLQEKNTGSPFDLVATKNNYFFAIECKEIENSSKFPLSRIESNQKTSYKRLLEVNSKNYYFLFNCPSGNFIINANAILNCKDKSIDVSKGIELEKWFKMLEKDFKTAISF